MGATELWLVRHGESVANVAASEATARGEEVITVQFRDADVPLSALGEEQARALGVWLRDNATSTKPSAVWVSTYLRARQTASIALEGAGVDLAMQPDERLRDRELGVLDLLTSVGVERRLPLEAARRRWLGKFYYRPPGGESWADVALRLRSFLRDMDAEADGECVLLAAHDAVILLILYVCCGYTEQQLVEFASTHTVTNASVTKLVRPSGQGPWSLETFAHEEHLESAGVPATEHPGHHNDPQQ